MSYRGRAQYGQNYRARLQYDQNYRSNFWRGNFRGIGVRILEVDIKVILGITTLKEVEIDLEKDSVHIILEELNKAVVGPDQVQE